MRTLRRRARAVSMGTLGASVGTVGRVVPEVALRVATHYFLTPRRTPLRSSERAIADRGVPLAVVSRDRTLRGWRWGRADDPAVLLVHGWSGRALQLGAFVEPLIHAGRRVVAFDLSAHGGSAGRHASIVALAEDVLAISNQLGPFDTIIAHSFGGPVTTLALVAGVSAKRAIFIAPPFDAEPWIEGFGRWLHLDSALRDRLKQRLESRVGLSFAAVSAASLAPAMTTPLLVIHDEDDREVSHAAGSRLAAAWPRAELLTTRGLGHHRILADPDVVQAAVRFAVSKLHSVR